MNDRQSIIGFTEAELGLFLAVIFLMLALNPGGRSGPKRPAPRQLALSIPDIQSQKKNIEQQKNEIELRQKSLNQQQYLIDKQKSALAGCGKTGFVGKFFLRTPI